MTEDKKSKLTPLILASLEGSATPQEIQLVKQQLENDPQAMDYYIELVEMYASLKQSACDLAETDHASKEARDLLVEAIGNDQLRGTIDQAYQEEIEREYNKKIAELRLSEYLENQPAGSDLENVATRKRQKAFSKTSFRNTRNLFISIAACLIVAISLVFVYQPKTLSVVAKVVDSYQAKWLEMPLRDNAKISLVTKSYHLISGYAEIEFDKGAKVILEGPVEIKLESANGAYLKHGKLVAKVPPQATGFTVQTPSADFIDLGTEFGLSVDNDSSVLSVFDGAVSVALQADPVRSQQVIHAGQNIRTDYGKLTITNVALDNSYVRSMPTDQSIESIDQVPQQIDCQTPKLYIAFESASDLKKKKNIHWQGKIKLQNLPEEHRLNNKVIQFDGLKNFLSVKDNSWDHEPQEWRKGHSWSVWVKPDTLKEQCVFKAINNESDDLLNNLNNEDYNSFQSLCITYNDNNEAVFSYVYTTYIQELSEKVYEYPMISAPLGEEPAWYHVAATMSKDRVRFYMNGRLVKEQVVQKGHNISGDQSDPMYFGRTLYPINSLYGKKRFKRFKGSMDEIMLFDCELTEKDISEIYLNYQINQK